MDRGVQSRGWMVPVFQELSCWFMYRGRSSAAGTQSMTLSSLKYRSSSARQRMRWSSDKGSNMPRDAVNYSWYNLQSGFSQFQPPLELGLHVQSWLNQTSGVTEIHVYAMVRQRSSHILSAYCVRCFLQCGCIKYSIFITSFNWKASLLTHLTYKEVKEWQSGHNNSWNLDSNPGFLETSFLILCCLRQAVSP